MRPARFARRAAYAAAALLIGAAGLLVLGDWLLGRPAVKAAVQQRVSAALGGQIAWEDLELRLLPAPRGELRKVRIEIPQVLSLSAEQVDAYLRLWPLLRGQPEIASFSISRPEIRVAVADAAQKKDATRVDPLAAYRNAVEPVARALRKFAPDTQVRIDSADIDLPAVPLHLRGLNATASTSLEGVELQVEAASNYWQRLRAKGRLVYADLSARAEVELDELVVERDLPPAKLRGRLNTDAKRTIEADVDATLGSLLHEASAKLTLSADKPAEVIAHLSGIDVGGAMTIARRNVAGLEAIESADGRLSAKLHVALGDAWRVETQIVKSDGAVKLAALPWKLSVQAGHAAISEKEVRVRGVRGALGDSGFSDVAAHVELGKRPRLAAASGQAALRLEQWLPWLRKQLPLEEVSALSGGVDVTLQRMALRFDRPAEVAFDAVAKPRQVSAALKALPAPVSLTAGSAQISATQVRLDRLAVAMLDAKALVSGTVATKGPKIELSLAEGALGEKLVQWAMARGEVPAGVEPKTPLRFSAQRLAWGPGRELGAEARIDFDRGPQLELALDWRPQRLEIRRLAVKDAMSDASFGALVADNAIQASFSGRLDGRSIGSMLRRPPPSSGSARGEVRLTIDRAQPGRTRGEGELSIEALDVGWLVGRAVRIERAEIRTQRDDLRIVQAQVELDGQKFDLQGDLRRTAQGPVIDARLESTGVVVDRLLPAKKAEEKAVGKPPPEAPGASKLWPLPLTGRVEVRAGFVQYRHYRIEPLQGSLLLERERASLQVKEARMCGISFPLSGSATPENLAVSAQITMKDQPLAQAGQCLTGEALDITGTGDLRADLRTQGKPAELLRNLSGTAQAELRKGHVRKFALIGNILSVLSLRNVVSRDATLREGGFPYRSLSAKGEFKNGEFLLEEGFFDSDAARIAASGRIDLQGANSHLDVLVGVLNTVDRVVGVIPIIGDIFGSTMLALPVSVNGDIRDPQVVPLGPRAITGQLLGIFERTLKLPGKLVVPETKDPPR